MPSLRAKRRDIGNLSIPLPPYPGSPASLAAATTFYNAARQEINDRVKFRDQVIIAIIAATFGLLGFINPFDSKAALASIGTAGVTLGSIGLGLFVVIAGTALVINFACRYCGYQNAKIAELGYFITSAPALHLQAYGLHELLAEPMADGEMSTRPEVVRIDEAHRCLRDSFAHWDGWAAATSGDNASEHQREFSQDGVYRMLLTQFSFLPLAILFIASFKVPESLLVQLQESLHADWSTLSRSPASMLLEIPASLSAIWLVLAIGVAGWLPIRIRRMMARAEALKLHFKEKRGQIDAGALYAKA